MNVQILQQQQKAFGVGNVNYQPFVIAAPELVESLAQRRATFKNKMSAYLTSLLRYATAQKTIGSGCIRIVPRLYRGGPFSTHTTRFDVFRTVVDFLSQNGAHNFGFLPGPVHFKDLFSDHEFLEAVDRIFHPSSRFVLDI